MPHNALILRLEPIRKFEYLPILLHIMSLFFLGVTQFDF